MYSFGTPWKHQKNQRFFGVFRGYKMYALVRNGLNWNQKNGRFNPLTTNTPPSYRNQSIDLQYKSIDWFLYDGEHSLLMEDLAPCQTSMMKL